LRYYRVDLLDLSTRRLSWRRLWSLISHLPRESATVQAVSGREAQWGDDQQLAALIVDGIHRLTWLTARAHFKDAPKNPPKPIRRPSDPPPLEQGDVKARYDDVLKAIEQLSGAPRGIAPAEEV
jgi:hypothetical protein